jgi:hypothetical protein
MVILFGLSRHWTLYKLLHSDHKNPNCTHISVSALIRIHVRVDTRTIQSSVGFPLVTQKIFFLFGDAIPVSFP